MYNTHAVVVITYKRPGPLALCLEKLISQSRPIDEIVVVDQSPDDLSLEACRNLPRVRWVDNRANAGNMTSSRNVGLRLCSSDVISFIDDDSMPTREWAAEVMAAFSRHPDAAAIAGRTTEMGSSPRPVSNEIGQIRPNGQITGNFDVDTREDVQVDHALGTNMSFLRKTLTELGGLREDFPGTAMGEDTDISLRVRKAGGSIYFAPRAHVVHKSAPHIVGLRFGLRYDFYASSNYTWLFLRNLGWGSSEARGRATVFLRQQDPQRRFAGRAARRAVAAAGVAHGVWLHVRHDRGKIAPLIRRQGAATPRPTDA